MNQHNQIYFNQTKSGQQVSIPEATFENFKASKIRLLHLGGGNISTGESKRQYCDCSPAVI
jgi:hypothetical protein